MTYSKNDFDKIFTELKLRLYEDEDDPLPCRLYDFEMPGGHSKAKLRDGTLVDHVADACNLASSIDGIYYLLKLVGNDTECEHLSRVLIRELGALREALQDAEEEQINYERCDLALYDVPGFSAKPDEKNIRLWADFLKHPAATIVAHQCFSENDEAEIVIDTKKLRALEIEMRKICEADQGINGNASKAWRIVLNEYSGKTVKLNLPSVPEIELFLEVTADRLQNLIARRRKIAG